MMHFRTIQAKFESFGFDVVQEFNTKWYNQIKPKQLKKLPEKIPNGSYAILIGNSKAIWPKFLEFFKKNPTLEDPLDNYVKKVTFEIMEETITREDYVCYFSCDTSTEKLVAFQKLSHVSGTSVLIDPIHLCIHENFGVWFALRAAIVFPNIDPQVVDMPTPLSLPISPEEIQQASEILGKAIAASQSKEKEAWKIWVEMRDTISYQREYRYDWAQIVYHYTKSKADLKKSCKFNITLRLFMKLIRQSNFFTHNQ